MWIANEVALTGKSIDSLSIADLALGI